MPAAVFQALHLGPPVPLGDLAAVFADDPPEDMRARARLVTRILERTPDFLPLRPNALAAGTAPAVLLRHSGLIKREMVRLAGRREIVISLSCAAPRPDHPAEGAGLRWLKQRSDHLRSVASLRKRAIGLLQTLSDVFEGAAEAQCLSPFGSSRVARVGADLALLLPATLAPHLLDEVKRSLPGLLPRGEAVACEIQGPLPPYSFVAPLAGVELAHGGARYAS
ncbi:MAG: GvpL/GvpF family gas vesicle protein [Pseudomonadota bacterium]